MHAGVTPAARSQHGCSGRHWSQRRLPALAARQGPGPAASSASSPDATPRPGGRSSCQHPQPAARFAREAPNKPTGSPCSKGGDRAWW